MFKIDISEVIDIPEINVPNFVRKEVIDLLLTKSGTLDYPKEWDEQIIKTEKRITTNTNYQYWNKYNNNEIMFEEEEDEDIIDSILITERINEDDLPQYVQNDLYSQWSIAYFKREYPEYFK